MSNYAWVTLATNDSYSLGALVVAHSLKRVHTAHQLAVLITPGVSEAMKNKLRTIFNVVEEVNLLDSKDDANLALLKRPELGITFTKLHCWRLTQFEKCVFLDADTLVLRNSDELFEREELSAAPDIGWPDCFNSGVYVYRPSLDTFSSLMQYAVTHGSFDGGDQGLLNAYFSDWAHKDISKHLPFIYNTSSVASYSYLPAFKQFGQNTKILHFIGTAKPWLQNFDSESRKVYIPGGYQHLANFLQYWWDVFCEDVHSRLSADMQKTFSNWIKPSQVSTISNAYRSSGTGSFYTGDYHGGDHLGGGGGDHNGNYNPSTTPAPGSGTAFHPHWDQFVPSYDATIEYADPWEEYLRKQEEERDRLARDQQKREEERLYYQYLDNQRLQEQHRRDHEHWQQQQQQHHSQPHHDHQHHHHHHHHNQEHHDHHQHHHQLEHHHGDHHGHQQDANVFQSTEQWVEHVHRHDHGGHWDPEPWQPDSSQQESGGGGWGSGHDEHHQHHHQQQQQQEGDHGRHVENRDHGAGSGGGGDHQESQQDHHHEQQEQDQHSHGGGDGSGLAGALSQLHLGEPKSVEQEVYEEHMRRQCWESGNIDYMGRDSFENIWRRITQTVSAGPSPIAAELGPSTAPVPPRAISPAPPRRRRSSKSRSRSNTPKRDPRDRSPTPQPEDNVPVEKKEVQIEAPIQEEDDNFNVGSLDGSPERSELPPPVQYDPMTSTTTLTKKVFAGYQQVITTKSQEGKTRTHVKTVYDPSVEDASAGYDAADSPKQVTSATVAESRIEPAMPLVVESNKQATPAPPTPKTSPLPAPVPESEHKSTPPRASPRPQLEQQVAQETMAGKQPSVEPIKTSRRKRLSSPQLTSPTITATQTTSSSKLKPQSKSTLALKTASAIKTTTDPSTPTTPKATAQEPTKTKPATASSSSSKSQSLPSSPSSASTPPSPQSPTPSSTNGRPKPTKKKTIDEIETAPLTANDELDNSSAPATPPVPPRRKRESKVSRIANKAKKTTFTNLFLSCLPCTKRNGIR
ncbi:probable serine/threonine-protein kinase kinX isoform X3 [Armigeres subalbatus]|uniref:probable serine/threonine-protein kinase kinX isoform X3 n=1 Tax=Armigeres subalbatus TaxID=124917 RepID=UPI002ED21EF0